TMPVICPLPCPSSGPAAARARTQNNFHGFIVAVLPEKERCRRRESGEQATHKVIRSLEVILSRPGCQGSITASQRGLRGSGGQRSCRYHSRECPGAS